MGTITVAVGLCLEQLQLFKNLYTGADLPQVRQEPHVAIARYAFGAKEKVEEAAQQFAAFRTLLAVNFQALEHIPTRGGRSCMHLELDASQFRQLPNDWRFFAERAGLEKMPQLPASILLTEAFEEERLPQAYNLFEQRVQKYLPQQLTFNRIILFLPSGVKSYFLQEASSTRFGT